MKCDFCSDVPFWIYDCETYRIEELKTVSEGGWAACQTCADLIDGDKWRELAERSCKLIRNWRLLAQVVGREEAMNTLLKIHAEFREHCKGGKRRIGGVN